KNAAPKWDIAYCLEGLASVVAAQGEDNWAARLWGAAAFLRESCGIPLSPPDRIDYEQAVAATRMHLGKQAFEAAWDQGRAMTLDQVLAAPRLEAEPAPTSSEQVSTSPTHSVSTHPAGLTAREVEV